MMDDDELAKQPLAERRGAWANPGGNSWESVLLGGGADMVAGGMEKMSGVALVERDITVAVLSGKLPAPDGQWALLVKLAGTDWVHYANPAALMLFGGDEFPVERFVHETGLRVLHAGYQDTAGATYVGLWEDGRPTLRFETVGEDFGLEPDEEPEFELGPTVFQSDRHASDWWKQFEREDDVQQALLRELDAYVPFVHAYREDDGNVVLAACHDDVIAPQNVKRVDLIVFGTASAVRPNPANKRLAEAIEAGDAEAVTEAIHDGADLCVLPGTPLPPITYAVSRNRYTDGGQVAIVRLLLDAGADANGSKDGQTDPPLIEAVRQSQGKPSDILQIINLLLDAGADVEKPGSPTFFGGGTALLEAVQNQSLSAVMLLHQRGASLEARDMMGRSARERAESMLQSVRENLDGVTAERMSRPIRAIIEYLAHAEAGGEPGDWRAQVERDQAAADSERRRYAAKGERFERALKQAQSADASHGREIDEPLRRAIEAQPDRIELAAIDAGAPWQDSNSRDREVNRLAQAGFEPIGDFRIDAMSGVLVRGLIDRDRHLYAAVSEHPSGTRWVDIVRFHRDGNTLTITNAPVSFELMQLGDVDRFEKLSFPGLDASELLKMFDEHTAADAGNERIEPEQFKERYEQFYADDIAAKKADIES